MDVVLELFKLISLIAINCNCLGCTFEIYNLNEEERGKVKVEQAKN